MTKEERKKILEAYCKREPEKSKLAFQAAERALARCKGKLVTRQEFRKILLEEMLRKSEAKDQGTVL